MARKPVTEENVNEAVKQEGNDIQLEIMKQLEAIKKIQSELLKEKQEFEKEKEQFLKEKTTLQVAPTASNEFIEVICNVPQFEVSELPAYDLGTRNSNRFIRMPKYGSKANMQFSDLQEILGYPSSGLVIGSILIDKKHKNAIRDLGLEKIYENIVYPEDMDEFLKKPVEEIEPIMKKCPERMKEAFIEICKKAKEDDKIDSVAKLRKIEEILNIKL